MTTLGWPIHTACSFLTASAKLPSPDVVLSGGKAYAQRVDHKGGASGM